MLFKGNSSKLELLIEKIQATKEFPDTLGTEPSWNSETADEDGISLSPSSCETPNSVATDGNEVEISFTIGPTDATPYACQFCEKAFPRLSYLKKHEQSHCDQMPFKCDFCQRLFKHKRSRDRHVKLHTGDKKYRCPHCESAFSRSDHLKIHLKTHDHQKPYQCVVCNRGYNTAAALTSHMQNHKKESVHSTPSPGTFRCLQCNGTFHSGEELQNHNLQMHRPISSTTPEKSADVISLKRFSSPKTPSSSPSNKIAKSSLELPGEQSSFPPRLNPDMLLPFPLTKLACIYCTKDSFTSFEALQLHVQALHGSLLGGELGDSPQHHHLSPIATPSGFISPDTLGSPTDIPCSFCTMKFPTITSLHKHAMTVHSLGSYLQAKAKENAFCASCAIAFPNSALYAEHFVLFHATKGHLQSNIPVASPEPLQVKPTDLSKKTQSSSSSELPSSSTNLSGMSREGGSSSRDKECSSTSSGKNSKREKDGNHQHNHHHLSSSSSSYHSSGNGNDKHNSMIGSGSSSMSVSELQSAAVASALAAHSTSAVGPSNNNNGMNPILSLVGTPVLFCSQCNAGFSDFENFRFHLKSHLEEVDQKYVCEECDSEFCTEEDLAQHSIEAHYLKASTEYGCQSCLKSFGKPDELQKHLMDIHAHHLYRCSLCKEMFDSKVSIQVHFAVKHSNECKLFRCNACSNVFRSDIEFQVHVKVVHLRKMSPYRCLLCNAAFSSELELQFHLQQHSKHFVCKLCDAAFHVEFLLDKHMETHHSSMVNGTSSFNSDHKNNNRSLKLNCSSLKLSGNNKKSASHLTSSTSGTGGKSGKELKCDICDKPFRNESDLISHRRQAHHVLNSHGTSTESATSTTEGTGSTPLDSSSRKLNHGESHQHNFGNNSTPSGNKPNASANCSSALSLSCAYCNENCKSRTDLENHMKTHQVVSSGKHKCNICDEICPSATLLAEHKLAHCKVVSGTTCTGCKQNITSEDEYYAHMKQNCNFPAPDSSVGSSTGRRSCSPKSLAFQLPLPCVICRQTLMSDVEIKLHSKFHLSKGSEPGNGMGENDLAKLISVKSSNVPHIQAQCCLCLKTEERLDFSGGSNGFSTEPTPFICEDCYQKKTSFPFPSRLFPLTAGATDHSSVSDMRTTKSPSTSTTSSPEDNRRPSSSTSVVPTSTSTPELKSYQCIKCQMSFASEQEIKAHVVIHLKNEGSTHKCHICNKLSFDSPLKLQCHLIEHTFEGMHSFTCYICSSVFTTAVRLQQHMLEHSLNLRPYNCPVAHCGLKFFFRTELDNHAVTHETLRQPSCENNDKEIWNKRQHNSSGNNSSPNLSKKVSSNFNNGASTTVTSGKQKRKRFFYRSDDSDEEIDPVQNVKLELSPGGHGSDTGPCGHKLGDSTFKGKVESNSNSENDVGNEVLGEESDYQQIKVDNQNQDGAV